jgi:hypothetical protein
MTDIIKLKKCCILDHGFAYSTKEMLASNEVESLSELNYDWLSDYDYMEIGLINENNIVVLHCDNIHGHPKHVIDGFIKGVESTGVIVEVEECVVGEENYELIFIQD